MLREDWMRSRERLRTEVFHVGSDFSVPAVPHAPCLPHVHHSARMPDADKDKTNWGFLTLPLQDSEDISRVVAGEIAALIRRREREGMPAAASRGC